MQLEKRGASLYSKAKEMETTKVSHQKKKNGRTRDTKDRMVKVEKEKTRS